MGLSTDSSTTECKSCEEKDKRIAALKRALMAARHDADEAEAREEELLNLLNRERP